MATPAQKKLAQQRLAAIHEANNAQFQRFKWTGFSGKTLWDWLQLMVQVLGVILIPLAIGLGAAYFSYQQNQTNVQIANDQQQEATLKTYLDDMTTLLLDKKLGSQAAADKAASDEAAVIARAKTLIALHRLNALRKAPVMQFLYEAHLIGYCNLTGDCPKHVGPLIDLAGADLSGAELGFAFLIGAELSGVDLTGAHLSGAFLRFAFLIGADLSGADLHLADLSGAYLDGANLVKADLSRAYLDGARYNMRTIWPQGFDYKAAGAICDIC